MKITLIANTGKNEGAFAETEFIYVESDENCLGLCFEENQDFMDFITLVEPGNRFFDSDAYPGAKICFLDHKDFSMKIFP